MKTRLWVSSFALGIVAACATPGQVRRVETQLSIMESQNKRMDSTRAADLERLRQLDIAQQNRFDAMDKWLRSAFDSLQQHDRNQDFDLKTLKDALNTLGVVMQQSANESAKARSLILDMQNNLTARPTDSTGAARSNLPREEQLISLADGNLSQRAYGEARNNLRMVIDSYPNSPQVAAALYKMGRTFAVSPVQADSQRVYFALVISRFPRSDDAGNAAYKLAVLEDEIGNVNKAKVWYQLIVKDYPSSIGNSAAVAWLKNHP